MILKTSRLTFISYLFNILFILTGAFFAVKRLRFQYKLDHPATRPTYTNNPQYAEQLNIEPAYVRPVNVILLGTSHVYKAHWDELLNRSDIGNRGIGSDITAGYLHRLQYVLNSHPRICFIEGGGNDIALHIPIDTIVANMGKLLDTLRYAHIVPVLQAEFYVGADYPASDFINGRLQTLNQQMSRLAASRHVEYLDLNPIVAPDGVLLPWYCQPDNIHLNAHAYLRWKDEIEKVLRIHDI
ncbi:MAG TPA: GDSL-type esterase/lipase family protein [Puia sp.]|nr:GDSL-type esterase/lipase family protein [Puia sp.]